MSLRTSAAKLTDAFVAKYAPPIPPIIIKSASPIIYPDMPSAYAQPFAAALSMTLASARGIRTSPSTSTIIQSGPTMK